MAEVAPKLEIRQKQSLTITPFLQQAIKILHMNKNEVSNVILDNIQSNPLLEGEVEPDKTEASDENTTVEDEALDSLEAIKQDGILDQALDADYENNYDSNNIWDQSTNKNNNFTVKENALEETISELPSLLAEIQKQIPWLCKTSNQQAIAKSLLSYLDKSGWLDNTYLELRQLLNCSSEELESVVDMLQLCEPTGVFARNLKDCLKIQLKNHKLWSKKFALVLDNLDLIAIKNWKKLQKLCNCNEEELKTFIHTIRSCNPKPASGYEHHITQVVTPDVTVKRHKSGAWQVELDNSSIPPVMVNKEYYKSLKETQLQKEEKRYLYDKWQEANWLLKAITQRHSTLLKVSHAIVKRQQPFFEKGIMHLYPMVLRDIADDVGMHESTVSRITTGKYMYCTRGVLELKFFFTATLSGTTGQSHSAESVRHLIKTVIDKENDDNILSDETIAQQLKVKGFQIARRTVAKYRDTLGIPGSAVRKRHSVIHDI